MAGPKFTTREFWLNTDGMSPPEAAAAWAIERVKNDANFRWYMIGTHTLYLCVEAEASRRGVSKDVVEREISTACERQREPDIVVLRKQLEEAESKFGGVFACDPDPPASEEVWTLERQIERCKEQLENHRDGRHSLTDQDYANLLDILGGVRV